MKEKCIDNARTIQDLKNMMNYINYNKEKYLLSNPNADPEHKNEYQGPIRNSILRENVIKIFFESIFKQFLIDIKKELKEKAEAYVIKECSENFL